MPPSETDEIRAAHMPDRAAGFYPTVGPALNGPVPAEERLFHVKIGIFRASGQESSGPTAIIGRSTGARPLEAGPILSQSNGPAPPSAGGEEGSDCWALPKKVAVPQMLSCACRKSSARGSGSGVGSSPEAYDGQNQQCEPERHRNQVEHNPGGRTPFRPEGHTLDDTGNERDEEEAHRIAHRDPGVLLLHGYPVVPRLETRVAMKGEKDHRCQWR